MTDFIQSLGPAYFGHLLMRLADHFVRGFEAWHGEVGLIAPARTYSTLRYLERFGPTGVTELASALRQSHPLVITWIRSLKRLELVETRADAKDARRTIVHLTDRGRAEARRAAAYDAVSEAAFKQLFDDCDADVINALWRLESACREQDFAGRLREATP